MDHRLMLRSKYLCPVIFFQFFFRFSAPEPKAQVHYCNHALSVVRRPSVRRPSSLTFHIFDFSSDTAERNSTKLDRKQDGRGRWDLSSCHVSLQAVQLFQRRSRKYLSQSEARAAIFFFDRLEKHKLGKGHWNLASCQVSSNSVQQFQRKSRKCLRQSEARAAILFFRSARKNTNFSTSSTKFVFWADRKNKMAALVSDWLRYFRLLLWNRWSEFNETWQEARSQRPLPSLCFFGPIGKTRWPPWLLIASDIFDFSSETAERNLMKLDRKQDFNVLYQVCVFRADQKKRWPPLPLIGLDIFDFSSETAERPATKHDRKKDLNVLYQVCDFLGWSEK